MLMGPISFKGFHPELSHELLLYFSSFPNTRRYAWPIVFLKPVNAPHRVANFMDYWRLLDTFSVKCQSL